MRAAAVATEPKRVDVGALSASDRAFLAARKEWRRRARADGRAGKQLPPPKGRWLTLIFKSGRGFGKTEALIQWAFNECMRVPRIIGHAVAPTLSDLEGTIMKGPSGFREKIPAECLRGGSWENAYVQNPNHELYFANGSKIRGFGATDGGAKLRGPQAHFGIGDELREWDKPAGMLEQAFSNFEFGIRLPYPDKTPCRIVCGTTPKNIPFLKKLYSEPDTIVVTGSTYENINNLDEGYKRRLLAKEGTQIGRVEIHGEDITEDEFAILKRLWIKLWPPDKPLPEFTYLLMSLDTAFEEEDRNFTKDKPKIDYSANTVWGVFNVAQNFNEVERKRMGVRTKYAALLCDFWMERLGFPDLLEKARKSYRIKYGPKGRARFPDLVLIENKASGISLRQSLIQYGVPTAPFDPMGQSKTMRAHTASPFVKQGMLWIPESTLESRKGRVRDWAEPLMDQLCEFAGEGTIEYDDAFDATVQAIIHLHREGYFYAEPQDTKHPDAEERRRQEEAEAVAIAAREKRRGVNPYAQ